MKQIFVVILMVLFPLIAEAKCVNLSTYTLKGYMEDVNNTPQTGKTLTEVKFDVFYDDGTSSIGNNATAEMGQGWYRYSYTSNGKSGIWVMRDSTGTYKNFPGGILETLCDSQDPAAIVDATWDEARTGHTTAGTFGYYLDAQVSAGSADWTATERNQIRYRLGVDGTTAAPTTNTPNLGDVGITQAGADKVWTSAARSLTDKAGFSLSAAGVDAILDDTIEGSYTMRQILCAMAAVNLGKSSGMGTATVTFRNLGDTVNRVSGTQDSSYNRTAVTLTLTGCP